ncbi:MAG: transcription antitermination factor NusB, partial [Nocardioides sp.]
MSRARPAATGRTRVDRSRLAARLVAYDVLTAVREDGAYPNLVLPTQLAKLAVSGRDAAFATELVSGTLRLRGTYDAVLGVCVDRPLTKLQPAVWDVLRLGCHQLLSMRVPDHAAIDSTVDLVRARIGRGPTGLVNAVLRKVARSGLADWIARIAPDRGDDPVGYAAVAFSHPGWIVEELEAALAACGHPGQAPLDALLRADNAAPPVVFVARPG